MGEACQWVWEIPNWEGGWQPDKGAARKRTRRQSAGAPRKKRQRRHRCTFLVHCQGRGVTEGVHALSARMLRLREHHFTRSRESEGFLEPLLRRRRLDLLRQHSIAVLAPVALQIHGLLAACVRRVGCGEGVRGDISEAGWGGLRAHDAPVATRRFHFEMIPLRSGSTDSMMAQFGPCSRYVLRSVRSGIRGAGSEEEARSRAGRGGGRSRRTLLWRPVLAVPLLRGRPERVHVHWNRGVNADRRIVVLLLNFGGLRVGRCGARSRERWQVRVVGLATRSQHGGHWAADTHPVLVAGIARFRGFENGVVQGV